jgi:hypothetical protein
LLWSSANSILRYRKILHAGAEFWERIRTWTKEQQEEEYGFNLTLTNMDHTGLRQPQDQTSPAKKKGKRSHHKKKTLIANTPEDPSEYQRKRLKAAEERERRAAEKGEVPHIM